MLLFSASVLKQLMATENYVNRKVDFFTKRIDSHNESIQIANWNALPWTLQANALANYWKL